MNLPPKEKSKKNKQMKTQINLNPNHLHPSIIKTQHKPKTLITINIMKQKHSIIISTIKIYIKTA
jgi:hypothetical protein